MYDNVDVTTITTISNQNKSITYNLQGDRGVSIIVRFQSSL